jgi:hypothetical protein
MGVDYKGNEKVYFIESGDSFLAVIPIDTGDQTATVKIEHWDNSEGIIKRLGREAIAPKELNPDDFVKLV